MPWNVSRKIVWCFIPYYYSQYLIYWAFIWPLQDLFVFEITSVTELTLGANTKVPVTRLKWTTDGMFDEELHEVILRDNNITLYAFLDSWTHHIIITQHSYAVPSRSPRMSSIGEPIVGPKFTVTLNPMEIRTFKFTTSGWLTSLNWMYIEICSCKEWFIFLITSLVRHIHILLISNVWGLV